MFSFLQSIIMLWKSHVVSAFELTNFHLLHLSDRYSLIFEKRKKMRWAVNETPICLAVGEIERRSPCVLTWLGCNANSFKSYTRCDNGLARYIRIKTFLPNLLFFPFLIWNVLYQRLFSISVLHQLILSRKLSQASFIETAVLRRGTLYLTARTTLNPFFAHWFLDSCFPSCQQSPWPWYDPSKIIASSKISMFWCYASHCLWN